jgi:four helix bundle protein
MSGLRHARSFRELVVYQKAAAVSQRLFELSARFPEHETYSLTRQIRRSSRSIGAQIAEAWGKRRYKRHFISKLTDADSEQLETYHWVLTATSCGYFSRDNSDEILQELSEIGRMLHSMIRKSGSFCGKNTRTHSGVSLSSNRSETVGERTDD